MGMLTRKKEPQRFSSGEHSPCKQGCCCIGNKLLEPWGATSTGLRQRSMSKVISYIQLCFFYDFDRNIKLKCDNLKVLPQLSVR